MSDFSQDRTGHGTYEWAEINANIQQGCSNGCLYCYARANALRFGKIKSRDEWREEKIDWNAIIKPWPKKKGVIMFPTAHDITPANIDAVIKFLMNVLSAGNKVLIVSKPSLLCTAALCTNLSDYRDRILFRFTIGASVRSEALTAFWEPGAPSPAERVAALQGTYKRGFQTSVSMEPMLAGTDIALETYENIRPYITETVWIGKMNRMRQRIEPTLKNLQAIRGIEQLQRDAEILRLVSKLAGEPNVRWKDSIKDVLRKTGVWDDAHLIPEEKARRALGYLS